MENNFREHGRLPPVQYILRKSSVPIIWLDTNVLIDLTRFRYGRAGKRSKKQTSGILDGVLSRLKQEGSVSKRAVKRSEKLFELLSSKTGERKLICPMGSQSEEYDSQDDDVFSVQADLANGISFEYRSNVRLRQLIQMVQAYLHKKDRIEISYTDAFEKDPVKQLKLREPIIVSAILGQLIRTKRNGIGSNKRNN